MHILTKALPMLILIWFVAANTGQTQSIPSSSEFNIRSEKVDVPEKADPKTANSLLILSTMETITPLRDTISRRTTRELQEFNRNVRANQQALTTFGTSLTALQTRVNSFTSASFAKDKKALTDSLTLLKNRLGVAEQIQQKIAEDTISLRKELESKNGMLQKFSVFQQNHYVVVMKQAYTDYLKMTENLTKQRNRSDTLQTAMKKKVDSRSLQILWLQEKDRFDEVSSLVNEYEKMLAKHDSTLTELAKIIGYKNNLFDIEAVNNQAQLLNKSTQSLINKQRQIDTGLKGIDDLIKGKTKPGEDETINRAFSALPNLVGTSSTFFIPNITILGRNDKTDGGRRFYGTVFVGADVKDSVTSKKQNLVNLMLPAASTFGIQFGYVKPFKLDFSHSPDYERINAGSVAVEGNFVWKRIPNSNPQESKNRYIITPLFHLRGNADITVVRDRLSLYVVGNLLIPISETPNYQNFYTTFENKPLTFINTGFRANFPVSKDSDPELIVVDFNLLLNNQRTRNFLYGERNPTVSDPATLILQVGYRASLGSSKNK